MKIDVPTAHFWYLRDGKIERFNWYVGMSIMFAQMGVLPDFAPAVDARSPTSKPGDHVALCASAFSGTCR